MKIYDCVTYYDEPIIIDLRFNILDKYVEKFIVVEALWTHSGNRKAINFDINDHPKFKNKICHIVVENEPDGIIGKHLKEPLSYSIKRENAIKRIAHQRNHAMLGLEDASDEDFIFYSDGDEIPDFSSVQCHLLKRKMIFFKQRLCYYKFNLTLNHVPWYGTKGCQKRFLRSIDWLRQTKSKCYPRFRLDTLYSKRKYTNVHLINGGGWHFSSLKNGSDLLSKFKNDECHADYDLLRYPQSEVDDMITNKYIHYDHSANSGDPNQIGNKIPLEHLQHQYLPDYINNNKEFYSDWLD
jgi:beta-1,4-mannosyl-glycoprotein beta-1,4-N-acetylglucosaminyltransferase